MAAKAKASLKQLSDEAVAERVQSILINAAEGRRNVGDDAQYNKLRRELIRRSVHAPQLVSTHPTVDSFAAFIRGIKDRQERVTRVRKEFEPLFRSFEALDNLTDSSIWTGKEGELQNSRLCKRCSR